jgi:hypothetical protein
MPALRAACFPCTALHSCCLSRPRTGRMLFSPCAQRIAYYAIMQKSAVVALALLAGSPADAFVLPASAIARVHIAGVPVRSPVPGLAPFNYPPWDDVGNMAELGMLFLACAPRSSPHKNYR